MSRSLNKAMLIGNAGADPEIRTTASGTRVANFSLATSRRWSTRGGEAQEKTEWHRIIAWDRLAEVVERFVRRGERVYVEGRVEYRSWEDRSGQTRYATEIVAEDLILLGGSPAAGAGGDRRSNAGQTRDTASGRRQPSPPTDEAAGQPSALAAEDDLPF